MRLVIDTNVLLSALMAPASSSAKIVGLWRSRKFDLLTATAQLEASYNAYASNKRLAFT